jgi:hypothetical protein
MRPLEVVERAPGIEGSLGVWQIAKATPLEDFRLERLVEPFVLALGLRMIGASMGDVYPETRQTVNGV